MVKRNAALKQNYSTLYLPAPTFPALTFPVLTFPALTFRSTNDWANESLGTSSSRFCTGPTTDTSIISWQDVCANNNTHPGQHALVHGTIGVAEGVY